MFFAICSDVQSVVIFVMHWVLMLKHDLRLVEHRPQITGILQHLFCLMLPPLFPYISTLTVLFTVHFYFQITITHVLCMSTFRLAVFTVQLACLVATCQHHFVLHILGAKSKFCAPIVSSVGSLQFFLSEFCWTLAVFVWKWQLSAPLLLFWPTTVLLFFVNTYSASFSFCFLFCCSITGSLLVSQSCEWYIVWPLCSEEACCIVIAVMFAYEQCLLCLGHHPDVWIEAAAYVEQASKLLTEKGVRVSVFIILFRTLLFSCALSLLVQWQ